MRTHRNLWPFIMILVIACIFARDASAARVRLWPRGWLPFSGSYRKQMSEDLWEGYKSIVLLPVRNETATGSQALANLAAQLWQENLMESHKFSVRSIHERNPVVLRGMKENALQRDDVVRWQQQPSLDSAFAVARPLGYDFIGDLRITGYAVKDDGRTLEISVAGALYDVGTQQKVREVVTSASSSIPRKNANPDAIERQTLNLATKKVADAFIGRSIIEPQMKPKREKKPKKEMESKSKA